MGLQKGFQPAKLWGMDNPNKTVLQAALAPLGYEIGNVAEAKSDFPHEEDLIYVENSCVIKNTPYDNDDKQDHLDNLEDELDMWSSSIPDEIEYIVIIGGDNNKQLKISDFIESPVKSIAPNNGNYHQEWSFYSDGSISIDQMINEEMPTHYIISFNE